MIVTYMNDDRNVRIGKSDDDSNDTEMIVTSDNNSVILVNIPFPYSVGEYRFYLYDLQKTGRNASLWRAFLSVS